MADRSVSGVRSFCVDPASSLTVADDHVVANESNWETPRCGHLPHVRPPQCDALILKYASTDDDDARGGGEWLPSGLSVAAQQGRRVYWMEAAYEPRVGELKIRSTRVAICSYKVNGTVCGASQIHENRQSNEGRSIRNR